MNDNEFFKKFYNSKWIEWSLYKVWYVSIVLLSFAEFGSAGSIIIFCFVIIFLLIICMTRYIWHTMFWSVRMIVILKYHIVVTAMINAYLIYRL